MEIVEFPKSQAESANKFGSRKFLISTIHAAIIMILPMLYKYMGISDDVLRCVLISSTVIVTGYTGLNVIDQKWNGARDVDHK